MPNWLTTTLGVVTAFGGLAQVVVAVVAVVLAKRANAINKGAFLQQRVSADLVEVLALARRVRQKYRGMFRSFQTTTYKDNARAAWMEATEEVSETLRELVEFAPEVKVAADAWLVVANTNDNHASNDRLEADLFVRDKELGVYEENYAKFRAAMGIAIRKLREQQ